MHSGYQLVQLLKSTGVVTNDLGTIFTYVGFYNLNHTPHNRLGDKKEFIEANQRTQNKSESKGRLDYFVNLLIAWGKRDGWEN